MESKKNHNNIVMRCKLFTKPCPFCGWKRPQLQPYKYGSPTQEWHEGDGLVVQCPECWAIPPVKMTWLQAVDAWENGEWSDITKEFANNPRNPETMDVSGALKLAEAVLEDAGSEYKWYLKQAKKGKTDYEKRKYELDAERMERNFFKGDSIIKALPIDGDDVVKTLRRQVEDEDKKKNKRRYVRESTV